MHISGAIAAMLSLVATGAWAQPATSAPQEAPSGANPVMPAIAMPAGTICLSRRMTDARGAARDFPIVASPAKAAAYARNGFAAAACPSDVARYRATVCRMALSGNDAVQKRLEQVFGAKPADLCAAIKEVAPFPIVKAQAR